MGENKNAGRRENRIAAMQFLYMRDVNKGQSIQTALESFFSTKENPREYYSFAEELIAGVESRIDEVDALIEKCATNWSKDRIAKVDLAILRLAIFELLFREDIPPVVSINEAIDLAKEFSSAEARRFVNGVLDNAKGSLKRPLRTANKK
ncbi:MAG: transcription antitermination factor NusB [Opitutales bacterium]|nr:transcription antitermination factor NusB [Opitutales bacterium]MBP3358548.1 transcription antitermination factor NusB [Opitutales bacterium]MBQ2722851.1 transcription antitermination factor NusB [Opitutales bacterium]